MAQDVSKSPEPILDKAYWQERLVKAKETALHHSVFRCSVDTWQRIEARHREILAETISDHESVLDAGCGYGRLLGLMPGRWRGRYLGVDLSPDFIALAEQTWICGPNRMFLCGDVRKLGFILEKEWDIAVLISIRPMVIRNCGESVWQEMESELRRVTKRRLYLEYSPEEGGEIE